MFQWTPFSTETLLKCSENFFKVMHMERKRNVWKIIFTSFCVCLSHNSRALSLHGICGLFIIHYLFTILTWFQVEKFSLNIAYCYIIHNYFRFISWWTQAVLLSLFLSLWIFYFSLLLTDERLKCVMMRKNGIIWWFTKWLWRAKIMVIYFVNLTRAREESLWVISRYLLHAAIRKSLGRLFSRVLKET